jgi:hypothetical protein
MQAISNSHDLPRIHNFNKQAIGIVPVALHPAE